MRGLCNGWVQKDFHANLWTLTGRVIARSVSQWLLTVVVRVHCRGSSCGIFGGQSGKTEEQEYCHKSKEAHKIIRNKKKTYMKNVIESIEEDQKHNNTMKMYQTVNLRKDININLT